MEVKHDNKKKEKTHALLTCTEGCSCTSTYAPLEKTCITLLAGGVFSLARRDQIGSGLLDQVHGFQVLFELNANDQVGVLGSPHSCSMSQSYIFNHTTSRTQHAHDKYLGLPMHIEHNL